MKIETQIRICTALQWACIGVLVLLALSGCASAPPRVEIQRVNVAVPVACNEPTPARPVMPTEALRPGADVDQFTQAATAEIERREGYEVQLRAALAICITPIDNESRPRHGLKP
ncbi:MAG: hypothetical protein EOO29_20155 [Comamonadaceae bacterium]|nr:MAG: hypothetical protein EOO29_20155 [Comamonadaceae bacterium]